jgi:hypothetical protein
MKKVHKHPVPLEYHQILFIGGTDRRGNKVDFKIPPVIIELNNPSIEKSSQKIFNNHIDINDIPLKHKDSIPFLVLRPTALNYLGYIKEMLRKYGIGIREEFLIDNFMTFSDVIYDLDPNISFHSEWRVIMHALHKHCFQNQNYAYIFLLEEKQRNRTEYDSVIMKFKKDIRSILGELPVIIKDNGIPKIGLGLHHLHAPGFNRVQIEYNVLMHAKNKTSIFKNVGYD